MQRQSTGTPRRYPGRKRFAPPVREVRRPLDHRGRTATWVLPRVSPPLAGFAGTDLTH